MPKRYVISLVILLGLFFCGIIITFKNRGSPPSLNPRINWVGIGFSEILKQEQVHFSVSLSRKHGTGLIARLSSLLKQCKEEEFNPFQPPGNLIVSLNEQSESGLTQIVGVHIFTDKVVFRFSKPKNSQWYALISPSDLESFTS